KSATHQTRQWMSAVTRAVTPLSSWTPQISAKCWSERRDSNPRPLVPQTSALTGLRYAPSLAGKSSSSLDWGSRARTTASRQGTRNGFRPLADGNGAIQQLAALNQLAQRAAVPTGILVPEPR